MSSPSLNVRTLRAAWWTHRALHRVRGELRTKGLDYSAAPGPPRLPRAAQRGVFAVLRRERSTCLERALVLQRWHQSQGDPRDVVVAVKGPSMAFAAHAWLDGDADGDAGAFSELLRLPPR
jgi:transglutaminase superfamily protein